MSYISTISLHEILGKDDLNYNDLKLYLEQDASSINERDQNGYSPLHLVLKMKEQRFPDVIRLLIHHGADVNLEFSDGKSPLQKSLSMSWFDGNEAIVKELLEGGTDMNKLKTEDGRSLVCFVLSRYNVKIARMLIEAGCPLGSCPLHESINQCFMASVDRQYLKEDLIKLMIENCRGLDLNELDNYERSLLCYAIGQFPESDVFKLLLESGCSWHACEYHGSPWLCAITSGYEMNDGVRTPYLTKSLVQMLIDAEPEPNVDYIDEPLLHRALKNGMYEISAIQLMFDEGLADIEMDSGESALHAILDSYFEPEIVKLLVDQGADINAVDDQGNTPLHVAMSHSMRWYDVKQIEALLKNGALVNVMNAEGKTPLLLGLRRKRDLAVLQLLLNAGAEVNFEKQTFEKLIDAIGEESYTRYPTIDILEYYRLRSSCTKLLIKYCLLEDPSIDMDGLIPEKYGDFASFVNECREELQRMESIHLSQRCTLHQLIDRSSLMEMGAEDYEPVNLDRLMNVLAHNDFPAYFDVIFATLDREDVEKKLQGIVWCAEKSDPETSAEMNIFLIPHAILEIASYLSDEELLKLIISSHISEI